MHSDVKLIIFPPTLERSTFILSNDSAMRAVDRDIFIISMAEELDKMWENIIYEIIKKSEVRARHSILHSV